MKHIADYWRIEDGNTVFILGNGPTLNNHDLDKLPPESCMTMNRSWREKQARYHISTDPGVIRRWPGHTFCLAGDRFAVTGHVRERAEGELVLVQPKLPGVKFAPPTRLETCPEHLDLCRGWPITHAGVLALHLAWWLGYSEAYLLGFDGYGTHYSDEERGSREPDHDKLHREMATWYPKFDNNDMSIWNCNPANLYGHDFCRLADVLDIFL